jgi:hypothetical protein
MMFMVKRICKKKLHSPYTRRQRNLGGYTGEGAKTVIASSAFIKISQCAWFQIRTGKKSQNYSQNISLSIAPAGVTVKKPHHGGQGYVT